MRYGKRTKAMMNERRLTTLEQQAKSVMDVLKRIDERTERLDHIIRGNGNPGLVTRIEVIEVITKELHEKVVTSEADKKESAKTKSDHVWTWWIAFGSLALVEVLHLVLH